MSGKSNIDVAVVIVTYNNEPEIDVCLEALVQDLTGHKFQIIIVDNASADNTLIHVAKVQERIKNTTNLLVTVKNTRNAGFTKALNQGLNLCAAEYILLLNPDTMIQKNCINTFIKSLQKFAGIGIVAPQLLNPDGSIQPSCRRFPTHLDLLWEFSGLSYLLPESKIFNRWKMGDFAHDTLADVEQPQGACLFFRREILETIGLWDERFPMFFSDVDWCKRVVGKGYKILFNPDAKVYHKKGAAVYQNRIKMILSSHVSFYTYFQKHKKNYVVINQIFGFILFVTAFLRIIRVVVTNHLKTLISGERNAKQYPG